MRISDWSSDVCSSDLITDGASAVQYVAFGSDTMSASQMVDFATRVAQPLITSVPGVASAVVNGGSPLAMRIWVDPVKLAARGLTATDIANALRANNVQTAPGQLKGARSEEHTSELQSLMR